MEVLSNLGATAVSYVTEKVNIDIGPEGLAVVRGVVATASTVRLVYVTSTHIGDAIVNAVSGAVSAVSPTLPLMLTGLYLGFSLTYKDSRERSSYEYRTDVHRQERSRQDKLRHERRLKLMKERNFSERAIIEEHKRYEDEKYGGEIE